MKHRFQRYIIRTEILLSFHTRVEYISRRTIHCWRLDWVRTHRQTDTQKWKHYIRQFHSVHLADIMT